MISTVSFHGSLCFKGDFIVNLESYSYIEGIGFYSAFQLYFIYQIVIFSDFHSISILLGQIVFFSTFRSSSLLSEDAIFQQLSLLIPAEIGILALQD